MTASVARAAFFRATQPPLVTCPDTPACDSRGGRAVVAAPYVRAERRGDVVLSRIRAPHGKERRALPRVWNVGIQGDSREARLGAHSGRPRSAAVRASGEVLHEYPIDLRVDCPERSSRGRAALTILLIAFLALSMDGRPARPGGSRAPGVRQLSMLDPGVRCGIARSSRGRVLRPGPSVRASLCRPQLTSTEPSLIGWACVFHTLPSDTQQLE